LGELEAEMLRAAENLEFERAAALRDRVVELKKQVGQHVPVQLIDAYTPEEGDENKPGFARGGRGKGRRRADPPKGRGRVPRPRRN
jgi:excinuclease ABC subunit B